MITDFRISRSSSDSSTRGLVHETARILPIFLRSLTPICHSSPVSPYRPNPDDLLTPGERGDSTSSSPFENLRIAQSLGRVFTNSPTFWGIDPATGVLHRFPSPDRLD